MNHKELERYLDNIKEDALKQVIRTLLDGDERMIRTQIKEFNKMYPRGLK